MPTSDDRSQADIDLAGARGLHGEIEHLRADVLSRFDRIERDLAEIKQSVAAALRRDDLPDARQIVDEISRRLGLR